MSHATISFIVLGSAIVLFVWNRLPVEVVALGVGLALYATGVLTVDQVFSGFGDPVVFFIATLFVVSEGVDATGVTAWAGRQLLARIGPGRTRQLVLTMAGAALVAGLISVNGAVAALLPMVVILAVRLGGSPSGLAMPLAFAAHAGSMLVLTGTPINVIVSDASVEAGGRAFGYFEFALVGVPLVVGTIVITLLLGERLLPTRTPASIPPDLSRHAGTLVEHYQLDEGARPLFDRDYGAAEIVVGPRSDLVGDTVFPGMATGSGDLAILAVQRKGYDQGTGRTVLAPGDSLLMQGTWEALDRCLGQEAGALVVDRPETIRRQAVPLGPGAKRSIAVLLGMVLLLATGAVPPAVAGMLAAGSLILLRVLTMEQAYRSVSWTTIVIVGGMIPLSTAIQQSGAADKLAHGLVDVVGDGGPHVLLLGVFVLTATLGQMISNTATALIVIPVAVSAAAETGVSARPVLMCVAVAAAASFLTPIATPANMMVKEPGGYGFGDYWRLGLPLLGWFGVVAVGLVPVFWRF